MTSPQDLFIVGLGNPGSEYAGTRHNLGWACLDLLARRLNVGLDRKRWRSRVAQTQVDGRRVWLIEPQTFMNLSGQAVASARRDLGVEGGIENVWVVHDELDLPLGRLRIKVGGSAAGHNGIRSVMSSLGSDAFVRFRVGVDKPPRPGAEAGIRWVLARFTPAEREIVERVTHGVADALEMALRDGVDQAMNVYNRSGSLGEGLP
ncbi:MAG TPA: aminoacyl-tRNA hydrolase [Candidatus Dormibacteraeota bacterium]|nr:aminoacyl-tRNA hydrolase [Candidatus Dormibacteraeota bacterium]